MEDVEPGGEEREQEEAGTHFDPGETASARGGLLRDNIGGLPSLAPRTAAFPLRVLGQ